MLQWVFVGGMYSMSAYKAMYSGGIMLKADDPISKVRFPLIVKSEAGLFVCVKW